MKILFAYKVRLWQDERCPRCNSQNLIREAGGYRRCDSCGHTWNANN